MGSYPVELIGRRNEWLQSVAMSLALRLSLRVLDGWRNRRIIAAVQWSAQLTALCFLGWDLQGNDRFIRVVQTTHTAVARSRPYFARSGGTMKQGHGRMSVVGSCLDRSLGQCPGGQTHLEQSVYSTDAVVSECGGSRQEKQICNRPET